VSVLAASAPVAPTAIRDHRLKQEFTPLPREKAVSERLLGSLRGECVWQHMVENFNEARKTVRNRIHGATRSGRASV